MIIRILIGQRRESYEGQYAPEALECITKVDDEANPHWLQSRLEVYGKEQHWESLKVVDIDIKYAELMKILRPVDQQLAGKIVGSE